MSHQYQLNWTDPQLKSQSITIIPETKNTSTSISLFGHHYANFGEDLNKNLLRLLENFASIGNAPANATIGQLWFDADVGVLKICTTLDNLGAPIWKLVNFVTGTNVPAQHDGAVWYDVVAKCLKYCVGGVWMVLGTRVSAAQPGSAAIGDLWFNTINEHYSFWNGSRWVKLLSEETHIPVGNSAIALARQNYLDKISFTSDFPMVEPIVEYDESAQAIRVTGKNVVLRIRTQLIIDPSKNYRFTVKLHRVSSTLPGGWPEENHIGVMPFIQNIDGATDLPSTGAEYAWNSQIHPNLHGLRTDPIGMVEADVIVDGASLLNNGGQYADIMMAIGTLPIYTNGQVDFNKVATFASAANFVYLIESVHVEAVGKRRSANDFTAHSDLRSQIYQLDGGTVSYDLALDVTRVIGKNVRMTFDHIIPADQYTTLVGSVLIKNIDCSGVFSVGAIALDDRLNPISVNGKSETLFVAKNAICGFGNTTELIGSLTGESAIGNITDINNIPGARWLRPVVYLNQNSILDGECLIKGIRFNRGAAHLFATDLTLDTDPSSDDHAATKRYVDTKLSSTGGVVTGFLSVTQNPLANEHAANKGYVDGSIDALNTSLMAAVDTLQASVNDLSSRLNDAYQRIYDLESRLPPPA
jgi:hypothetical protein